MTKEEFALFSMALKTYFPKDNLLPSKEALELWYRQLMDIQYTIAEAFLQKWVATEKWAPTIAEIRGGCSGILNGEIPDWGGEWERVLKLIGRYGYMQEERALAAMPPLTRRAVEMMGWQRICTSDNEVSERANFRNNYEALARMEAESRQLPAALKETISKLQIGAGPMNALPGKE